MLRILGYLSCYQKSGSKLMKKRKRERKNEKTIGQNGKISGQNGKKVIYATFFSGISTGEFVHYPL